uniref:Pentatricopeptide repeat-containing protein n=1 Tax=Setaria italica TaxID=4555 RepID=K3XR17_SETIT
METIHNAGVNVSRCKHACIVSRIEIFSSISFNFDLICLCALVDMYAKCQAVLEANRIFGRILNKDVVTWNSMIAGYAENSMDDDALMLFKQMRLQGASPDATSVVNALSASVCLGDLVMDVSVWGAFLHGCGLHSRLQFGEEAFKRMMVLHPERPDLYGLISNLYTSYGMWEKSLAIQRWMQEKGLVKLPGCSSVGPENG